MATDHDADRIRAQAQRMLREETVGSARLAGAARIDAPIAVRAPDGRPHSWFVPITVGDHLAGFFQFLRDGTYMRFSSFQRREGDLTGCPVAADWLDPDHVRTRADIQRRPDETGGAPFLTYDRTPDRLVWAVPLTDARGVVRLVYVAGQTVYLPPPEGTYD